MDNEDKNRIKAAIDAAEKVSTDPRYQYAFLIGALIGIVGYNNCEECGEPIPSIGLCAKHQLEWERNHPGRQQ